VWGHIRAKAARDRNKDDLLKKLRSQRLPIEISLQALSREYPAVFADVRALEREGLIYYHRGPSKNGEDDVAVLYYLGPPPLQVDSDIKALWHSAAEVGKKRSRLEAMR